MFLIIPVHTNGSFEILDRALESQPTALAVMPLRLSGGVDRQERLV